jgi:hypothetical protein
MTAINEYWEALARLKDDKPIRIVKGSIINKDAVALEAGRKRGSIKKSRQTFADLIAAIDLAALESMQKEPDLLVKLEKERSQKSNYRDLYQKALNRELMLLSRLADLEKRLKKYDNVTSLFKK